MLDGDGLHEATRPRDMVVIGFDSAWTDAPKAPGAICAVAYDAEGRVRFHEPELVSFAQAHAFIERTCRNVSLCFVALDQPTVVPNALGSRPVDKVAASLVSFVGGGVQPANRGKTGMFCNDTPVWPFLDALGATQDPVAARRAKAGLFVMEVFPALALPSLSDGFSGRLMAPKYNPANRRKFRRKDWDAVSSTVASLALAFGVPEMAGWADRMRRLGVPRKSDQDKLDAVLCALVGLIWRAGPPEASAMIGDLASGYMVTPLSPLARSRIEAAAKRRGVPIT